MQNQPESRKYHFIYKTTCTVTEAYYIGMHSTDELDDRYLGSGKLLQKSIAKYGRSNHKRDILEMLPSREALKSREENLVTEELLKDPKCLNLVLGGYSYEGHKNPFFGRSHSQETRERLSKAKLGRPITPEVKAKLSEASSKALSKTYLVVSPTGETLKIKGLKRFCKEQGLVYPSLFASIKLCVPTGGKSPGWLVKRL